MYFCYNFQPTVHVFFVTDECLAQGKFICQQSMKCVDENPDYFVCTHKMFICIDQKFICDGHLDCMPPRDQSDEANCKWSRTITVIQTLTFLLDKQVTPLSKLVLIHWHTSYLPNIKLEFWTIKLCWKVGTYERSV